MKKTKVTNDLEDCFQWREGLDPDHIFDKEKEMIKQLREIIPELDHENDKFVAVFLFARRHDIQAVTTLLRGFFKRKADHFESALAGQHIPSFKYTPLLQKFSVSSDSPMMHPTGYRDKYGRMVRMMVLNRVSTSSSYDLEQAYAFSFWQVYYIIETEPLNSWRNGIVLLLDLKRLEWGNINVLLNSNGREIGKAIRDIFPFRVRSMLAVNGNLLISALANACKVILPKKIMERARLVDIDGLKEVILPEYLVPHFGGNAAPFSFQDWEDQITDTEEELFAKGIWKIPTAVKVEEIQLDGANAQFL